MTPAGAPAAEAQTGTAWYVYGIVPAPAAGSTQAEAAGGEVAYVVEGSVAALARLVPLEEFGEHSLERNLRDPAWLEQKVRAHQAVLERAHAHATVAPFRFGTLFRDEAHLRETLAAYESEFAGVLERLRGRHEIGVTAHAERQPLEDAVAAADPTVSSLDAAAARASKGEAYMLGRRREAALADAVDRFAADFAREAHAELGRAAVESRLNPLRPEVPGGSERMLLNAAYLVASEASLLDAVGKLEQRHRGYGVRLEATGPWPPYNFVPADLGRE